MDDLISRQAAIDAVNRAVTKEVAIWSLQEMPSAQQERKRGEWIQSGIPRWRCSCCGKSIVLNVKLNGNYCPNCGADMGGENNG